jgi:hypothetical protein
LFGYHRINKDMLSGRSGFQILAIGFFRSLQKVAGSENSFIKLLRCIRICGFHEVCVHVQCDGWRGMPKLTVWMYFRLNPSSIIKEA